MIAMADLLQIAASGLSAATQGMQVVSNNTANVNTPGYNAQSLTQTELVGAPGGVGVGTEVTAIARAFDQFVSQQVTSASAATQAAQTLQTNAQNVSSLFPVASGGAGGLGAAIDSFFSAANQVAADPSSTANRTAFLSAAQSLTALFNSVGGQLADAAAGINGQVAATVQQVNGLTSQIAALNKTIVAQSGAAAGPPNALLDQRDQLVQQLSQSIGVTVVRETGGALDLYTSGGAALVSGATATTLAVGSDAYGGDGAIVNTATGQDISADVSGGTIGGLLASRRLVEDTQGGVGALASALAGSVNAQQSLGLDLNGNLGGALFAVSGPTVTAAQSNTGNGALTAAISDSGSFSPADFVVTKTATGFEAANQTTGQLTDLGNGPTLTFDGLTVTVSGTANTGDSFKLAPTANAAQSLRLATNDPAAIAAASAYVATGGGGNTGGEQATGLGAVAGSAIAAGAVIVPAADFGQNLTVRFTSQTGFNVLDGSNAVIASGSLDASGNAQIAVAYPAASGGGSQYAAFSLSGGPAGVGDSLTLTPGGAGSNGNITALAGIASNEVLSGQTLGDAYAALVTGIGGRSQQAQIAAQTSQAVLTQAQNTQQSISGVNLDEQAADLVSYQQAYQASAQVIATAQALFQSLINAVHG